MKSLAPALLMTVALACPAQERLDPAALMAAQREAMAKLVIEGRGYESDGRTTSNALGIISYDVAKGVYTMRSYAMGDAGDFPVTLTADGFTWSIPAGPTTIRYIMGVAEIPSGFDRVADIRPAGGGVELVASNGLRCRVRIDLGFLNVVASRRSQEKEEAW